MSRTYRRLKGDISDKKWILNVWVQCEGYGRRPARTHGKPTPDQTRELARYHSDNFRSMTTPSWWIRMEMQKPLRVETRQLIHKVMKMNPKDLDCAPVFPHWKKPHIYYW